MPLRQSLRLGGYLAKQRLLRREKFPLLVELEPLFACNLKCAGCGKIAQPVSLLKKRMPVEQAVAAIEESGAPMVSIAGGEPLMHPEVAEIVRQLLARKKIVFLCTNAVLLPKHLHRFTPHRNFVWMVHVDGLRERHDASVCKDGVFDQAPDQEHWLGVEQTRELFRKAFADGRRKRWRLNHSPVFLDFLEGKLDLACTAWAIPSYSLLGWQRPCYLLDDGYVATYRELVETTDWSAFGRGNDPRCANCMAHCGYEPSAVLATVGSLRESVRAAVGH